MIRDGEPSPEWLADVEGRHAAGRERILSTAAALFADRGVDNVTAEDVARHAGCSRATMYRHVGGKRAVVAGVMFRNGLQIVERVARQLESVDAADRVIVGVQACLAAARADRTIMSMLAKSSIAQFGGYFATMSDPLMFTTALGLHLSEFDAQIFARTYLSLLTWPLADPEAEYRVISQMNRARHAGEIGDERR